MTENQRITITVHGRVQGVFYRDSTMRKAAELGLTGTVRNRPDGTVEIIAEGRAKAVDRLVMWAQEGPPAAVVSSLETSRSEPTGEFDDFKVVF